MFKSDGGPAFPIPFLVDEDRPDGIVYADGRDCGVPTGMSLRDWFAGQALANYYFEADERDEHYVPPEVVATECYAIADAMLAAREVKQ